MTNVPRGTSRCSSGGDILWDKVKAPVGPSYQCCLGLVAKTDNREQADPLDL